MAKMVGKAKIADAKAIEQAEADQVKYSQNPEFIGQAFALYCKGLSLPNVADALKPEWPEVCYRTLQRIAQDNGWAKSRAVYMKLHADAQASAEGLVPEVVLTLQKVRTQMEGRGLIKAADVFAYRALVEDLLYYTGKHPKLKDSTPLAVSNNAEIAALLEAISEDEVMAGAWKRRRSHIEKAYRDKLAAKDKGPKGPKGRKGQGNA